MSVRTVTVIDCRPATRKDGSVISGVTNNKPWTIYRVQAVDDTGLPIQEKITSFVPLTPGEQSLEWETKHDEKWGTEHTVKPANGHAPSQGSSQPVSHPDEYEMMRDTIRMLAERMAAIENHLGLRITTGSSIPTPAVQTVPVVGAANDTDEVPF